MKIAYFILVHHKSLQFRWLWRSIYCQEDTYCIHIDLKAPDEFYAEIRDIVGDQGNVHWLPRRSIAWAGWSQVSAELDAMRLMLARGNDWQRWINLSGQDYPIRSIGRIRETLKVSSTNYIRCWSFEKVAQDEPDDIHLKRRVYLEYGGKIHRMPIRVSFPLNLNFRWKGSSWHMFSRSFCEWVISNPLTRRVARTLRFSFSPDELFFQALIMNSPFVETVDHEFGRFVLWPGPKILRSEDFSTIMSSPCLFARKFDYAIDEIILRQIASACDHATPS